MARIIGVQRVEDEAIQRLLESGLATWNGGKPKGASIRLSGGGKTLTEMVIEDRGGSRMIVYCDTSALIKLYIDEANSDEARKLLVDSSVLVTCRITWAEVFATFAPRTREVFGDAAAIAEAGRILRAD